MNNTLSFDELPAKFDLREYGWVSPVKNQGFMGACWAFGNMAALESALMRYANVTYSLSVNNAQNSMIKYSKYESTSYVEGGHLEHVMQYLINWLGIFPDVYDGYDELGKISSLYITPENIHIQNAVLIPKRINVEDNDLIKEVLIKYGVVAVNHMRISMKADIIILLPMHYITMAKTLQTMRLLSWVGTTIILQAISIP